MVQRECHRHTGHDSCTSYSLFPVGVVVGPRKSDVQARFSPEEVDRVSDVLPAFIVDECQTTDQTATSGASIVLFCVFATFMLELYYLSIAFQAGYHASAEGAGIKLLPLVLVMILVLMASSRIIAFIGRFKWIIITGPCFLAIACGLLYTVKYGTSIIHLYGYQVIMGFGIGLTMQNCMLAVQFELKSEPTLISAGTGTAVFRE